MKIATEDYIWTIRPIKMCQNLNWLYVFHSKFTVSVPSCREWLLLTSLQQL